MKKKILAISLVVSLVAVAALGVTLAYFTDTGKVDNTFTVGNIAIELSESVANDGEQAQTITEAIGAFEYEAIVPGDSLTKAPLIANTGDNDAYVFMKLTMSDASAIGSMLADLQAAVDAHIINFDYSSAGAWQFISNTVEGDNRVIWIGYKTVLAPGTSTSDPFTTINIPTDLTAADFSDIGEDFTLTVEAHAIQADNIADLTAAFTALTA